MKANRTAWIRGTAGFGVAVVVLALGLGAWPWRTIASAHASALAAALTRAAVAQEADTPAAPARSDVEVAATAPGDTTSAAVPAPPPPPAAPAGPTPAAQVPSTGEPTAQSQPSVAQPGAPGAAPTGGPPADAVEDAGQQDAAVPPTGNGATFAAGGRTQPVVRVGQDFLLRTGERIRELVVVMGNVTIAGEVERDVVVVLGTARLEPTAVVHGSLVVTAGSASIAEGAVVRRDLIVSAGSLEAPIGFAPGREYVVVGLPGVAGAPDGLIRWLRSGLLWGRLIVPSLGWIWIAAFAAVFFYLLVSLIAARGVKACADAIENRPLSVFLVGLLVMVLVGPAATLLALSVIGIPVIPFLVGGIVVAAIVGKVGLSRWIGRGIVAETDSDKRAQATRSFLIGSAVILFAYALPIVGLLTWMVGTTFGLGAATLAFVLALRREMPERPAPPPAPPEGVPVDGGYRGPDGPIGTAPAAAPAVPALYGPPADPAAHAFISENGPPSFGGEAPGQPGPAGESPYDVPPDVASVGTPPDVPPPPPVAPGPRGPSAAAVRAGTRPSDPTALPLLPKATFLERLGAFAIDVLLVFIIRELLDVGSFRGFVTLLLGYHIVFWALRGTTVGGGLLNLRVVRVDGRPLTFPDALIRGLVSILSVAALGLGCLWILFDPDRQAWHDRFAGTWVVKVPR